MGLRLGSKRGTYAVGFDDAHLMAIDPKEERGKCAGVQDPESVCLSRFERQRRILVETDLRSNGRGVRPRNWT